MKYETAHPSRWGAVYPTAVTEEAVTFW